MSILTINDKVVEQLTRVVESTELRDANGKLLGVFVPATKTEKLANTRGVRTTREVFERLRTLTNDPERLADLDRHIEELKRRDEDACAAQ